MPAFLVKRTGLKIFLNKIARSINTFDQKLLNEIGEFARDRIKGFTRIGKSISGDDPVRLKPLSESYKQFRRGKVTFWKNKKGKIIAAPFRSRALNNVDKTFFKPNRSNLTFTGQMLNSMDYKINVTNWTVIIKTTGARNQKVAGYVSVDRPFMGMDRIGLKRIISFVRKAIRERIREIKLKK